MNGWSTMLMIHKIGLVFIGFWILGTIRKEGLWSNLLLFFNWCIASYGTLLLWQPAVKGVLSLVKPAPDAQLLILGIGMAVIWVVFLIILGLLRTATDSLSQVKLAFHPVFDRIGTIIIMMLLVAGIRYSALPMQALLELGKLIAT